LLEEYRAELECPEYTMYELLKENWLTKLSIPTIYQWMSLLRFKYESRKKCYYVDGHEKPETKAYRKKFIKRYFEYKRLATDWSGMSKIRFSTGPAWAL
jgi:hypothetical protein